MSTPKDPLLSVIVVAYKSRDEIESCLGSLPAELNGRPVEVIVVDNSVGDGTGDRVRCLFPQVTYVAADRNLGFGRANNLGFQFVNQRSECVLFLNPDTVCNKAAIDFCVRRLKADSSIGMISPKLVLRDGSMDLACRRSIPTLWDGFCRASGLAAAFPKTKLFSGYNLTYLPEDGTYDVGAINGAFMMGRRALFEAVAEGGTGGQSSVATENDHGADGAAPSISATSSPRVFDERFFMYGDDLDLCIRVKKAGYRIVYDGRFGITHLKGTSVAKEYQQMSRAIFDANRDVYLKHFNSDNSFFVRWKYIFMFDFWKHIARLRAKVRGSRRVRPL